MTSNQVEALVWAGLSVIAAVGSVWLALESWQRWHDLTPITSVVRRLRDHHLVAFLAALLVVTFAGGMLAVHFLDG